MPAFRFREMRPDPKVRSMIEKEHGRPHAEKYDAFFHALEHVPFPPTDYTPKALKVIAPIVARRAVEILDDPKVTPDALQMMKEIARLMPGPKGRFIFHLTNAKIILDHGPREFFGYTPPLAVAWLPRFVLRLLGVHARPARTSTPRGALREKFLELAGTVHLPPEARAYFKTAADKA
jgi:hypothetical protein